MRVARRITAGLAWALLATAIAAPALGAYLGSLPAGGPAGLAVLLGGIALALLLIVSILISTAIHSMLHVLSMPPARARSAPVFWVWVVILGCVLGVVALAWSELPGLARAVGLVLTAATLIPTAVMAAHVFRPGAQYS